MRFLLCLSLARKLLDKGGIGGHMTRDHESGKVRVIKGSLLYFWEELKTLNMRKLKALFRIISGYLKMKFGKRSDLSLDGR